MSSQSNEENRIIHSETSRLLSRIELETAVRISRRAAQLGFLVAVTAMQETPVTAADVERFFPNLDGAPAQPGDWLVTVTDADHLLVSRRIERGAEPLSSPGYHQALHDCARMLLDLAESQAQDDSGAGK